MYIWPGSIQTPLTHQSCMAVLISQKKQAFFFFSASEYSIVNFVIEIMCLFSNPYILHRTFVIRCLEKNLLF